MNKTQLAEVLAVLAGASFVSAGFLIWTPFGLFILGVICVMTAAELMKKPKPPGGNGAVEKP